MMTAQQRIEAILDHGGFKNVTTFANVLGLAGPQKIYDIQSGKVKSISADPANKIFQVFPELNQEWVTSGNGDMLRPGFQDSSRINGDGKDSVTISYADVHELISQTGKLIDIILEVTKK